MLPVFELRAANVERRASDIAQQHVVVTDYELVLWLAHRRGTVAAAARLMEQNRAVLVL